MTKSKSRNLLPLKNGRPLWRRGALWISLLYLLAASVWLIASDRLVMSLNENYQKLNQLLNVNGLFLLLVTTVLIYWLLNRLQRNQSLLTRRLKHSEQLYRQVFSNSPEAQLIYDPDSLIVLDANSQARSLFSLQRDDSHRTTLNQLFTDNVMSGQLLDWLSAQAKPDNADNRTFQMIRSDGKASQVSLVHHQILHRQDRVGYLVFRDVSEVRRYIRNVEHAAKRLDIAREVSGMGCWEIDLNRQQIFCCNTVSDLLGLDTPANTAISLEHFNEIVQTNVFRDIAKALDGAENLTEVREQRQLLDTQQRTRHVLLHAQFFAQNETRSIVGTLVDQTAEKETEIRLRQQQALWNNLVETLPEGVAIIQEQRVVYANEAVLKMLHASNLQQVSQRPLEAFVHPDDLNHVKQRMANIYAQQGEREGFFHRNLLRLDGEPLEAEIAARLISYEGKTSIQIVVRDLTEAIRAKEALESANRRLASLSSKTLDMLERERKRIAGELHDDVGQSLTAIKLATRWLARRLEDHKLLAKAEDIQQICAHTLETVRNLSLMLRPAQLDSLGLPAAIEWQMEKLFSDIPVQFSLDVSQFSEISDKKTEIIAFRVIQESLTNIVRHAQASTIEVTLITSQHSFNFMVVDDGIGFDVSRQNNSTGLVNMKERVELADGSIQISSLAGVGTEIRVSLPLTQVNSVAKEEHSAD